MTTIACDISEYQRPVSSRYRRRWLIFRACDGSYPDRNAAHNLAWCRAACVAKRRLRYLGRKRALIDGYTAYVVYRPGENAAILDRLRELKLPAHAHVMVDVESWGGQITGDHSTEINQLVDGLTHRQGSRHRVWCYGNAGDLARIYPHRPDWIGVVIASYGVRTVTLDGQGRLVGHQYTDGTYTVPGLPRSSRPFGRCDHNQLNLSEEDTMPTAQEVADALLNTQITVKDPVSGKKVKARVRSFLAATWQHAKLADIHSKEK